MNSRSVTIGTVAFLINEKKDQVLLLERSGALMQNKVTGVGGKTNFEEDILTSCIREIKEETGFEAQNLKLKGIIKTINDQAESSWILFVYVTGEFSGQQAECPEGRLFWVKREDISDQNLIGFIREILPYVMSGEMIEGTIRHDNNGDVIQSNVKVIK